MRNYYQQFVKLPARLVVGLITLYQLTLSPDHSWLKARFPYGFCRHYPSCSQYTKEAVDRYGVVQGLYLGIRRVIRCNPWVQPSIDSVPTLNK